MPDLSTEQFISRLYREAPLISLADFPYWALALLRQVIDFDGAIWGSGHTSTRRFHTHTSLDVPDEIFSQLLKYAEINPILKPLQQNPGCAVNMSDVFDDHDFYQSELYKKCFKPFAIERILSSIHVNQRSGIFTLLTLYRYDRSHCFSNAEKQVQNRLLYHLLSGFSHRQLLALQPQNKNEEKMTHALCDAQGIYHAAEDKFLDLIDMTASTQAESQLPVSLLNKGTHFVQDNLTFRVRQYGDLYKVSVRKNNCFDDLTAREKEVVEGICQGQTFKQIARQLCLSPSTVSNHLYRIYLKLNVHTRSELIALSQRMMATGS